MRDYFFKKQINDDKNNVFNVIIPLKVLFEEGEQDKPQRNMVVFLGNNFRDSPGVNFEEAMRLSNLYLDYIRREYGGCGLVYRPHPAETDEFNFLNLSDFIIDRVGVAETFYIKNIKKIKAVFATSSMGSLTAYNMGLNSYSFINIFDAALEPKVIEGYKKYFKTMPDEFFINDLDEEPKNHSISFSDYSLTKKLIRDVLAGKSGNIWLVLGDTANLINIAAMARLIKQLDNKRRVNLIIDRHHRWDNIDLGELNMYFDEVFSIPRIFYSMRPGKISNALSVAGKIRKFPIKREDIILEIAGLSFADNCFASYFRENTRIALMPKNVFNICCGEQSFDRTNFRTRPGAIFFNLILEPILGLERTAFLEDRRRIHNVYRYSRPINDIYDHVWVFDK